MSSASKKTKAKPKSKTAPGKRLDPGWEHGDEVDNNSKKVKCRHCGVVRFGGVFRLKHHLGGTHNNVEPCLQVPDDVKQKFLNILKANSEESQKKKRKIYDVGDESCEEIDSKRKKGKGVMDGYVRREQVTVNHMFKRGERDDVCQQIARFFYTSAIPFNVVNNPEFTIMVDRIGRYGPGLKLPSYHELRVTFLKKEVLSTLEMLEEYKLKWKKTGCTIMSDGWSDRKRRSICNFMVNSPRGTVFLSSVDTSEISKTADKVFEMLDAIVEKVGDEHVVQIVIDNASNYKAAGEKLMEKRTKLYWTPCAAHCIDLMLEDLDKKIKVYGDTIAKAKRVTTYIYSRTIVLTWMRGFTKGRELIRPAVTRFATSYLTLKCLHEQKGPLLTMFSSNKWRNSKFGKTNDGKSIARIMLDTRCFWHNVVICLKGALPLVKVLCMVDLDANPPMGFIYEAMDRAKDQIKENFNNVQRHYEPVWKIIDERWEAQLHRPLHATAYYLNPQFHYSPNFKADADIKIGLYSCLQRMVPDPDERVKIDLQMDAFKNARGLFGVPTAIATRSKKSPADWWDSYGDEYPELKRFTIRILSLTCSSSGCERNWSAFEMVHSKRRNRLHQQKMNDLVFVMYNLKLRQRQAKRSSTQQPICLDDLPSDDEWITEQEQPTLPTTSSWLGVLDRSARREARDVSDDEDYDGRVNVGIVREADGYGEDVHELCDDDVDDVDDDVEEVDGTNPSSTCGASNDLNIEGLNDDDHSDDAASDDDDGIDDMTVGTNKTNNVNFGYNSEDV